MKGNRALEEAYDLIGYFYHLDDESEPSHSYNSKYFRASVYRMIIMEFHLAIESLLQDLIYDALPKRRAFTAQQNRAYVEGLSFSAAVDLAARLGILNKSGYDELLRLNRIRNRSAHDWILGRYKMGKPSKGGSRSRQYRVDFNGKELFRPQAFKHEFMPHYGDLYVEFFSVANGLRHKRRYINDSRLQLLAYGDHARISARGRGIGLGHWREARAP